VNKKKERLLHLGSAAIIEKAGLGGRTGGLEVTPKHKKAGLGQRKGKTKVVPYGSVWEKEKLGEGNGSSKYFFGENAEATQYEQKGGGGGGRNGA